MCQLFHTLPPPLTISVVPTVNNCPAVLNLQRLVYSHWWQWRRLSFSCVHFSPRRNYFFFLFITWCVLLWNRNGYLRAVVEWYVNRRPAVRRPRFHQIPVGRGRGPGREQQRLGRVESSVWSHWSRPSHCVTHTHTTVHASLVFSQSVNKKFVIMQLYGIKNKHHVNEPTVKPGKGSHEKEASSSAQRQKYIKKKKKR